MLVMILMLLFVTGFVRCSKIEERLRVMEHKIRSHTLQLAYWEQDYASFKQDVTTTLEDIKLHLLDIRERVPANAETPREIQSQESKGTPSYAAVIKAFATEKKNNQEVKKLMTNVETVSKQQDALNNTLSTVQNRVEHIYTRMNAFEEETSKQKAFNEHLSEKVDGVEKVIKEVGTILKNDISLINMEMSDSNERFLRESSKLEALNIQVQDLNIVLKNEKKQRDIEIFEIKQHLGSQEVAFSARLGKSVVDLEAWQTVVFDYVLTNKGNGYRGTTGIFKAPRKGVYVFFTHIMNAQKTIEISVQKNGINVMFLYAAGNTYSSYGNDANMVVLELAENDEVKVVKHGPWGTKPFYLHAAWTTFSGFMLYAL